MSFFGKICDKITGQKAHPTTPQAQAPTSTPVSAHPVPVAPATPFTPQPVHVDQVLSQMAEMKGGGGNWRTSIVDYSICST
ncbi:DUF3597 family protein [Brevundimonas sp. NIBR10]|uniref:DUF3597 family protein n=1 Tax=Brevundimonas sp. NIBR10 TaxID=3015997 RepID=UPI0022F1B9FF|nr:DUF3597 family protein [Brevundimonas sp. NIBR10]